MLTFDEPKYTIYEARIVDAEDVSDATSYDVAVRLTLNVPKLKFPLNITIGGNFKRNGTELTLGSTIRLKLLFNMFNINGALLPNLTLSPTAVANLIARDVYCLRYRNKDGKYKTYNNIDIDAVSLEKRFLEAVDKKYINDYE